MKIANIRRMIWQIEFYGNRYDKLNKEVIIQDIKRAKEGGVKGYSYSAILRDYDEDYAEHFGSCFIDEQTVLNWEEHNNE